LLNDNNLDINIEAELEQQSESWFSLGTLGLFNIFGYNENTNPIQVTQIDPSDEYGFSFFYGLAPSNQYTPLTRQEELRNQLTKQQRELEKQTSSTNRSIAFYTFVYSIAYYTGMPIIDLIRTLEHGVWGISDLIINNPALEAYGKLPPDFTNSFMQHPSGAKVIEILDRLEFTREFIGQYIHEYHNLYDPGHNKK